MHTINDLMIGLADALNNRDLAALERIAETAGEWMQSTEDFNAQAKLIDAVRNAINEL